MFNLKIFFKKYLSVIKKGDLISLFIFSFIYPQLGLENMIHLNSQNIYQDSNQSSIQFYNSTDILYITEEDSSKIYKTESIIESNYKLNNLSIKSQLSSYYSIFKTMDEIMLFRMQKKYNSINSEVSFKYKENIIPLLFFQLDDNDNFSYGVGAKIFKNDLDVLVQYKLFKYVYDFYFMYDEFVYYQNFLRNEENYSIDIAYDKPTVNHLLKINYKNHYIPNLTINDISQYLDNDSYTQYNVGISSMFNLSNDKKLMGSYQTNENKQTITLHIPAELNGDDPKIIDIKELVIKDDMIKMAYLFKLNKSHYNIGFLIKKINFECTSRLKPGLISDDLEVSLGAPTVNNYDIGEIVSKGIFLTYNKILKNNLNFTFNTIYVKDKYDIIIKNTFINSIFDWETRLETFEIKSKEAFEIGFRLDYFLKNINLTFSFDQHVPFKFEKFNDEETNSVGSDGTQYGGGKFQIMISKKI